MSYWQSRRCAPNRTSLQWSRTKMPFRKNSQTKTSCLPRSSWTIPSLPVITSGEISTVMLVLTSEEEARLQPLALVVTRTSSTWFEEEIEAWRVSNLVATTTRSTRCWILWTRHLLSKLCLLKEPLLVAFLLSLLISKEFKEAFTTTLWCRFSRPRWNNRLF